MGKPWLSLGSAPHRLMGALGAWFARREGCLEHGVRGGRRGGMVKPDGQVVNDKRDSMGES